MDNSLEIFTYDEIIKNFMEKNDWQNLLTFVENSSKISSKFITWALPDVNSLHELSEVLKSFEVSKIYSIGSGTGFFEWIISKYDIKLNITGVEIDRVWWESNHSTGPFIHTIYSRLHDLEHSEFYQDPGTAMMFCYFNNPEAFQKYLNWFEGQLMIIIGPNKASGRHCCPLPIDEPILQDSRNWVMHLAVNLKWQNNLMAIYISKT